MVGCWIFTTLQQNPIELQNWFPGCLGGGQVALPCLQSSFPTGHRPWSSCEIILSNCWSIQQFKTIFEEHTALFVHVDGCSVWDPPGDKSVCLSDRHFPCIARTQGHCSCGEDRVMKFLLRPSWGPNLRLWASQKQQVLESCYGLGLMFGPPLGGVLYSLAGFFLPFWFSGVSNEHVGFLDALASLKTMFKIKVSKWRFQDFKITEY